jgi:alkanesulfonate monooxygenase SsuD/methylene tetrahydromethanopterin reductase-like flavin-dependent oxidoreductase (luciferase family)
MESTRSLHPWVAERRDRITFAIQTTDEKEALRGPALLEAAPVVEDLGFDAIFLGDHPAWAPECYTWLTAIAMVTKRVFLGPMVASAPYRNPLLTARLVSDIDHLSGGRFVNGLGIGWNASEWGIGTNEFERMGLPYPSTRERQQALEETIAIIRGVWGPEPFSFDGASIQIKDAQVPPPRQQPEPPLCIAGGGRNTLNQVARLADMSNFGPGPAGGTDDVDEAARRLAVLEEECRRAGRDHRDILRSHFIHWLILAEDQRDLEAKIARYFEHGISAFWSRNLVALTVPDAVDYFGKHVDIGMQYFVCQILDPLGDQETMELLAKEVRPHFSC